MATYRIGDVLECVCLAPFGWSQTYGDSVRIHGTESTYGRSSVQFDTGDKFYVLVDRPEGGYRSFKQIFRLLDDGKKTELYLTPLPFKDLRLDKKFKIVGVV